MSLALPGVRVHVMTLYQITGSYSRASFSAWMAANAPTGDEENSVVSLGMQRAVTRGTITRNSR
jgi:hypothetical protein